MEANIKRPKLETELVFHSITFLLIITLITFVTVGCGGGGGGSGITMDDFVGTWEGTATFDISDGDKFSADVTITVNSNGKGTIYLEYINNVGAQWASSGIRHNL